MAKMHIYFVGIGGIGVSALARFYNSRGFIVSGSDLERSEITDALKKEGIRIFIGRHKAANVPRAHDGKTFQHSIECWNVIRVIYTAAVRPDNPELQVARKRRIPVLTYAQALGELTKKFKTVAVAGAHGKTTTTALIALALIKAGLDPTVIIGTKLREFKNSNFRRGRSAYLVIEADEWKASFLNYSPTIAVVTNIDREHLDFYKNIRNIESTFLKFLSRLNLYSWAVLNGDDQRLRKIAEKLKTRRKDIRIVWFSLKSPEAAKIRRAIKIPGRHNISNALAAYTVASALHIPQSTILKAIGSYRGAWRRFDYQGVFAGAKVFADYAHHPTEIKATLEAAREKFPKRRIITVFQPHHYERTRDLFAEFTESFGACNLAAFLDIYQVAGREKNTRRQKITSRDLANAVAKKGVKTAYLGGGKNLKPFLQKNLKHGDILLMMGAGSIWEMTKRLMKSKVKNQKSK